MSAEGPVASESLAGFQFPTDDEVCMAAGVEELETMAHNHHTLSAQQEDLILQNRILSSRAHEMRLLLQKMEEDMKFLKHQVLLRDKKLESADAERSKYEGRLSQLQKLIDDKDKANLALRQAQMDLRHQIDGLKAKNLELQREARAAAYNTTQGAESQSANDRRFEEMFRDKVAIIRLRKKIRAHFMTREHTMQALERNAMEAEDSRSAIANEMGFIDKVARKDVDADEAPDLKIAGPGRRRASSLICFDAVKRHGRGGTGPCTLPYFEELDLSAPQDAFVEAKIRSSAFQAPIANIRSLTIKAAQDIKASNDKALQSLYYIFEDSKKGGRGLLANPKEDFEKEIRQSIVALRNRLHDVVKALYGEIISLINQEKPVRAKWLLESAPRADFSCQVDVVPPEDPRIAQLREQLQFHTQRNTAIRSEFTNKISQLELLKDKAEVNTQYIQQKLFQLHDAIFQALHSIYRHRFRWIHRFANTFLGINRSAKKDTQLGVSFNVRVGQAVDQDMHYLKKLADYFVSDELFGSDMSSGTNAEGNGTATGTSASSCQYLVSKRKDSVTAMPTRKKLIDQARRLSGQVETFLKDEASITFGVNEALTGFDSADFASSVLASNPTSTSSTPLNALASSLRDENTVSDGAFKASNDSAAARHARLIRSANSSPVPKTARPQSARCRSGSFTSATGGSAAQPQLVPSRPPLTRKPSIVVATEPTAEPLRRVNSSTTNVVVIPSQAKCAKVNVTLDLDAAADENTAVVHGTSGVWTPRTLMSPKVARR